MSRGGNAACAWGRRQVESPVKDFTALCLQFVRMCFDVSAVQPSANAAWAAAARKHRTTDASTIPRGVPVFWQVGNFGHVALSLGGGLCLSTDVKRRGRVDVVRIDAIRTAWGAQLLGWTEDINGVRVWRPRPVAPPAPKAPVPTNVRRARDQLKAARNAVAIADRYLADAPDVRKRAHAVGDQLDQLDAVIEQVLRKLPKR